MIYLFSLITSSLLCMLRYLDILVELHSIRVRTLPLFCWTIDGGLSAPELDRCFYWREIGYLFSLTTYVICLLPFILIPSTCFNMSRFIGAMSIERSETSVEASYSNLPFAEHVAISWTPDYVLFVWCFNGNINSSKYVQSCTRY